MTPLTASKVEFAYAIGQRIQAREVNSNNWCDAVVISHNAYRGKPGYYIQWDPRPYQSHISSGGWTYEACMRPRP